MVSIRKIIPTLIITPIVIAVGLTGWLAFRSGKQSVEMLGIELNKRIVQDLQSQVRAYLDRPQLVHQLTLGAIRSGSLTLQDLAPLERYLWHQVLWDDAIGYSYYGNESGDFVGIEIRNPNRPRLHLRDTTADPQQRTYRLNDNRERIEATNRRDDDPRNQPWYETAKGNGEPAWSPILPGTSLEDWVIHAVVPVYDADDSFTGVLGIEIPLQPLNQFFNDLELPSNGVAFIMEPSGRLISSSSPAAMAPEQSENHDDRPLGRQSSNPTLEATVQALEDRFDRLDAINEPVHDLTLSLDGEQQWVAVHPIQDDRGLHWLTVAIIPEADFMGYIYETARHTIALFIIALLGAIILGLALANWLIQPILRLSVLAQTIETGQFDPDPLKNLSHHSQEIGQLARVFQTMASTIAARQRGWQEQMQHLHGQTHQAKKAMLLNPGGDRQYFQQLLRQARRALSQADELQTVNLADRLKTISYFKDFSDADIEQLIDLGKRQVFPPREYVCRQDEPGDAFFIILQGSVDVLIEDLDQLLTHLEAGAFFGELSLLLGIPRTASVRTREDTLLFVLDRQGLQTLLHNHHHLAEDIAQALDDYNAELEARQELLRSLAADQPSFQDNPLSWIRQRLATRFNLPSTS